MTKTNKQKFNRHIILYVMVITLFFISPVFALDDGNLEYNCNIGTNPYWSHYISGSFYTQNRILHSIAAYEGSCGIYLEMRTSPDRCATNGVYQSEVDFTGHNTLTQYVRLETFSGNENTEFRIYIDGNLKYSRTSSMVWTNIEIDTTEITGVKQLKYELYNNRSAKIEASVDNIVLAYVEPPPCTINYNPEIPITNTKPFNLTYTLNDTFDGFWARIYSWVGTDISPNDTPNIIWLAYEEGGVTWVDNEDKNYVTSDYFHNYDWWDLNESYGVVLYNIMGHTPGMRFDDVMNGDDPNALDWDQIYVNYSWNATPPQDPTPEPTPDPTPDPTPSGTPTPEPTATSQPDPEPINESLNVSFTVAYHGLVNESIDGYFVPVYNFTDYIAQPLTMLNQTLSNFTVNMNETFSTASLNLGISTNILFLILSGFPSKITNLFGYYLCWVIILLIFKGQT